MASSSKRLLPLLPTLHYTAPNHEPNGFQNAVGCLVKGTYFRLKKMNIMNRNLVHYWSILCSVVSEWTLLAGHSALKIVVKYCKPEMWFQSQGTSHTSLGFVQSLSEFCPSFVRVSSEFRPSFVRVLSKFCLSFVRVLYKFRPSFVCVLSEFYPSFTRVSSKFCLSFCLSFVRVSSEFCPSFVRVSSVILSFI